MTTAKALMMQEGSVARVRMPVGNDTEVVRPPVWLRSQVAVDPQPTVGATAAEKAMTGSLTCDFLSDILHRHMLRMVSTILLLAVFPRLLLAMPDGNIVCFAKDHVALGCHESVNRSVCDESASSPLAPLSGLEDDDDTCVDVAVSVDGNSTPSATGLPLAKFLTTLLPVLIGVLEPTPAISLAAATFDELPRSFCARTFCCSIALRC